MRAVRVSLCVVYGGYDERGWEGRKKEGMFFLWDKDELELRI